MLRLCVRRLKDTASLLKLRTLIGRQDLPMHYLRSGECYGFYVNKNLVAGYCLVYAQLGKMQSILMLPKHQRDALDSEDPFNYVELVGYFMNTQRFAFKFKFHLVKKLLLHKAKCIVYSYPTDQSELYTFTRKGNPLLLYSGLPETNTGHSLPMNVEIMTKKGVLKICLDSLVRTCAAWYRERFRS